MRRRGGTIDHGNAHENKVAWNCDISIATAKIYARGKPPWDDATQRGPRGCAPGILRHRIAHSNHSMGRQHLVRVGSLGHIGRFTAVDAVRYPRHARVVVRTGRGLELAEVLAPPDDEPEQTSADGSILRGVTPEDELLQARLERHRQAAYEACSARLAELQLPVVLMDVEHLFDGRTLVFYFLGEVTPRLEALTAELAELYETKVQFRRFTEAVTEGCGPGCGTEAAAGCKTCVTGCAVASACSTRVHAEM